MNVTKKRLNDTQFNTLAALFALAAICFRIGYQLVWPFVIEQVLLANNFVTSITATYLSLCLSLIVISLVSQRPTKQASTHDGRTQRFEEEVELPRGFILGAYLIEPSLLLQIIAQCGVPSKVRQSADGTITLWFDRAEGQTAPRIKAAPSGEIDYRNVIVVTRGDVPQGMVAIVRTNGRKMWVEYRNDIDE